MANTFIAKRHYNAWVRALKWQVDASERVASFQERWSARKQKKCLLEMQRVTQYLLRVDRTYAKARRTVIRNSMAEVMSLWKDAFVARHLEQRLTKF